MLDTVDNVMLNLIINSEIRINCHQPSRNTVIERNLSKYFLLVHTKSSIAFAKIKAVGPQQLKK
jgi:hypothetical protein